MMEQDTYLEKVEWLLQEELKEISTSSSRLNEACRYSVMAGGKRIRPLVVSLVSNILSGNDEDAVLFGTAIEFVHTYSLIHDDLPSMDNDDIRRGKPSCHIAFDEATAILAGDALLTHAFSVICKSNHAEKVKHAVYALSTLAGLNGMVSGQEIDMMQTKENTLKESLLLMYELKTSNLLRASVAFGCIASGIYSGKTYDDFQLFAKNIGIAYQIQDDILDYLGSESFGRPKGSDEKNGKITSLSFMTLEEAQFMVKDLTEKAIDSIREYSNTQELISLASSLINRKK